MFRALFASLFVLFTVAAEAAPAAPFRVKNAKVVRVRVGADSKPGVQLVADEHGWRMKLDAAASLLRLSVIDVTPGTPAQTMLVRVNAGEALFDAGRFQGGHVYRVSAPGVDGASFVYLLPSAAAAAAAQQKGPGRVDFDEGEKAVADEGGIEPAKKGSL